MKTAERSSAPSWKRRRGKWRGESDNTEQAPGYTEIHEITAEKDIEEMGIEIKSPSIPLVVLMKKEVRE